MKVVGFIGSARRNGQTIKVAEKLAEELSAGEEKELIFIDEKNIKFCIGCEYCRKHEGCSQKEDDMAELIKKIIDADAVIIGSPVYFGELSSLTKVFTDRLYPAYRGGGVSKFSGKKLYLVYSQESSPEWYADARAAEAKYLFQFLGFDIQKVYVNGVEVEHE